MNLPRKKKTKEEKMKPFLWARKKNSNENRCVKQRGKKKKTKKSASVTFFSVSCFLFLMFCTWKTVVVSLAVLSADDHSDSTQQKKNKQKKTQRVVYIIIRPHI